MPDDDDDDDENGDEANDDKHSLLFLGGLLLAGLLLCGLLLGGLVLGGLLLCGPVRADYFWAEQMRIGHLSEYKSCSRKYSLKFPQPFWLKLRYTSIAFSDPAAMVKRGRSTSRPRSCVTRVDEHELLQRWSRHEAEPHSFTWDGAFYGKTASAGQTEPACSWHIGRSPIWWNWLRAATHHS